MTQKKSLLRVLTISTVLTGASINAFSTDAKATMTADLALGGMMRQIGKFVHDHTKGTGTVIEGLTKDFADAANDSARLAMWRSIKTIRRAIKGSSTTPSSNPSLSAQVDGHIGFTLSDTALRFVWRNVKAMLEASDSVKGLMQTVRDVLPESVRPLVRDIVFSLAAMQVHERFMGRVTPHVWKLVP